MHAQNRPARRRVAVLDRSNVDWASAQPHAVTPHLAPRHSPKGHMEASFHASSIGERGDTYMGNSFNTGAPLSSASSSSITLMLMREYMEMFEAFTRQQQLQHQRTVTAISEVLDVCTSSRLRLLACVRAATGEMRNSLATHHDEVAQLQEAAYCSIEAAEDVATEPEEPLSMEEHRISRAGGDASESPTATAPATAGCHVACRAPVLADVPKVLRSELVLPPQPQPITRPAVMIAAQAPTSGAAFAGHDELVGQGASRRRSLSVLPPTDARYKRLWETQQRHMQTQSDAAAGCGEIDDDDAWW